MSIYLCLCVCVCVCVCVYIYIYIYIYIYNYDNLLFLKSTFLCTHTNICTYAYIYVKPHSCARTQTAYTYMYIHIHTCILQDVFGPFSNGSSKTFNGFEGTGGHIYICIHMYICIHICKTTFLCTHTNSIHIHTCIPQDVFGPFSNGSSKTFNGFEGTGGHMYMHTYVHMHTYVKSRSCVPVCTQTYVHMHTHTYMHTTGCFWTIFQRFFNGV